SIRIRGAVPRQSRMASDESNTQGIIHRMRFTVWLVLLATLMLWSGNWIVARAVREDIVPGIATMCRLLVVIALLAPFALPGLLRKWRGLGGRDWRILAGLGLTGGGVHLAMQWLSMQYTTATSGILFLSTAPIFLLLLAPFTGERIRALQWIGVAVSFCGVAMNAGHGDLAHFASLRLNVGDLLALGSMAMWAGYTVLLRMRRDPLGVIELLFMVCVFGLCFMVPWGAVELLAGIAWRVTLNGAIAVVYSSIASLLLAYAGWSYVVARLGAARAGATMHLMPAMGVGLSALFLGEYPSWYHFAGIGLILAGVALSSRKTNKTKIAGIPT